ncbi:peptide-methionine (R)-S-oxide reductase MsrB [Geomesophilobacter sediminis]|uniref:Peptide methionine sulfoxide reductase MsrB n=1 Tax=Geomesophilobacter sediminis TaxID=2798584 RepID=A0A8J7JFT7_9BACT|nr:peptide-methionine (R)-S-oxide reductase MsrB [Geomesophilobacter sediminis]MBJ6726471.1 peptide-methionine (R)-S-oxide reductase MsrB [Geomesophilobacter sediminis]
MRYLVLFLGLALAGLVTGSLLEANRLLEPGTVHAAARIRVYSAAKGSYVMSDEVVKTKEQWKMQLTPEQFHVLREKGTERAFTGKLANNHEHGIYRCAGCGLDLYRSEDKFESGTGWPSFTRPIAPENIGTETDRSFFTTRTEVHCRRCGGHLGHVFDDGPKPTGLRYCMNSAALEFVPTK